MGQTGVISGSPNPPMMMSQMSASCPNEMQDDHTRMHGQSPTSSLDYTNMKNLCISKMSIIQRFPLFGTTSVGKRQLSFSRGFTLFLFTSSSTNGHENGSERTSEEKQPQHEYVSVSKDY